MVLKTVFASYILPQEATFCNNFVKIAQLRYTEKPILNKSKSQSSAKKSQKKDDKEDNKFWSNILKKNSKIPIPNKSQPSEKMGQKVDDTEDDKVWTNIFKKNPKTPMQNKRQSSDKTGQKKSDNENNKVWNIKFKEKVYVTNLSFMDALSITPIANTEVSELFNEIVVKGMNEAEKSNSRLVINGISKVGIPNNDEHVNQLIN